MRSVFRKRRNHNAARSGKSIHVLHKDLLSRFSAFLKMTEIAQTHCGFELVHFRICTGRGNIILIGNSEI